MATTIVELIDDLDTQGIAFQIPPDTDDRVLVGVATQNYFDDEGNFGIAVQVCLAEEGRIAYFVQAPFFLEQLYFNEAGDYRPIFQTQLLEIANLVNNKVKFSSFSVDDEGEVLFVYALPLEEDNQKLGAKTVARVCEAIADAADEFYRLVKEYVEDDLDDIEELLAKYE